MLRKSPRVSKGRISQKNRSPRVSKDRIYICQNHRKDIQSRQLNLEWRDQERNFLYSAKFSYFVELSPQVKVKGN